MAFVAVAVGGLAAAGAIGGAMKSGSDLNMYGRNEAGNVYNAYKNLVGQGPGEKDISNAYNAQTEYGTILNNTAANGLYDSAAGNRLAEQQFAPQRQALAQSLQDQMATANRAASAAGRSTNDPILRARLGAEAMRSTAALNSEQYGAAMDLGRQNTTDMLNLRGQRVNLLQGLADTAFNNQNNLFNMSSQLQQMDQSAAQYDASRGGGLKGAITGGITGAGAGLQFATGFGNISNAAKLTSASTAMMNRIGQPQPSGGSAPMPMSPLQSYSSMPSAPQYGPSSPDALSRAGMLPNGWNYGMQFGPGNMPQNFTPQFAAPNLSPYFNSSNFAR